MKNIIEIIKKITDFILLYVKNPFDGIKSSVDILFNSFVNSSKGKEFIELAKKRITADNVEAIIDEIYDHIKERIPAIAKSKPALEEIIVNYLKRKINTYLSVKAPKS